MSCIFACRHHPNIVPANHGAAITEAEERTATQVSVCGYFHYENSLGQASLHRQDNLLAKGPSLLCR